MRLIFIRHGDPDYVRDSLTEKGWKEAALLAERVSRWKVDAFYCSPLGRAQDTASLSLKKMGREATTCDWLREFSAKIIDPISGNRKVPWDFMPDYWTPFKEMHQIEHFGEVPVLAEADVQKEFEWACKGLDDLLASYGYVREGLVYKVKEHRDDTIVLFCHMGITLFLMGHLLNISPMNLLHGFFLAPTSVTILTSEEREGNTAWFRTQTAGDTTHLYIGEERVSRSGYFTETFPEWEE